MMSVKLIFTVDSYSYAAGQTSRPTASMRQGLKRGHERVRKREEQRECNADESHGVQQACDDEHSDQQRRSKLRLAGNALEKADGHGLDQVVPLGEIVGEVRLTHLRATRDLDLRQPRIPKPMAVPSAPMPNMIPTATTVMA